MCVRENETVARIRTAESEEIICDAMVLVVNNERERTAGSFFLKRLSVSLVLVFGLLRENKWRAPTLYVFSLSYSVYQNTRSIK